MKLLAACDDTGGIKFVKAGHGTDTNKADALQPEEIKNLLSEESYSRSSMVLQMIQHEQTGHIIATRLNGSVEVYEFDSEENELKIVARHENVILPHLKNGDEKFISLEALNGRVYAGSSHGQVFIWAKEDFIGQTPLVYALPLKLDNKEFVLESIRIHPGQKGDLVVVGGKEIDLRVFKLPSVAKQGDSNKIETVFLAKNLHNKRLDMKMKIHLKDIQILPDSTLENLKIYTFTAFGEMRYYETKDGKKPRCNYQLVPKSIVRSQIVNEGKDVIISDEKTQVIKFKLEDGSLDSKFKDNFGTIQSLHVFKNKVLSTGGLDRYIRSYYINDRKLIAKIYLGVQISNVILLEDEQLVEKVVITPEQKEEAKKKKEEEEDEDDDEMWTKLESTVVVKKKRRRIM